MQYKQQMFFKVLLNKFHPGAKETILKNLPSDESKAVFTLTATAQDPSVVFSWPETLLSRTHYSWIIPSIQLLPRALQTLAVASLPQPQRAGLTKLLHMEEPVIPPSPAVKKFLLHHLYALWSPSAALPLDFLPPTQLALLLHLSKKELVEICEFLALYDLAEAIRHIVDKKYLKTLYLCLSHKQQQFLRICLHKREKLTVPPLQLETWDQQPETLQFLLHQRGLLRLGKALCGQSSAFIWHITHTLDTGRGALIAKYYLPDEIPGVTAILVQQLLSLINFLKQMSKA